MYRYALLGAVTSVLLVPAAVAQESANGSYTAQQAVLGAEVFRAECQTCHGSDMTAAGVPPLRGEAFAANWGRAGRTLRDLYQVLSTTMPPGRAPELSDDSHLAALAYLLQQNGVPPGQQELTIARLADLRLEPGAGYVADRPAAPDFIAGEHGLEPSASGPSHAELVSAVDNANDR